ncbi:MAG TPA: nucleoside hydrolase [Opitutaceae bacterium]
MRFKLPFLALLLLVVAARQLRAAEELVIFDNDWNAPGSYIGQAAIMPLLASPHVKILGFTTVTGDCWRDEGASSLLRYLEEIGAADIPVANGALFPLVNTWERMNQWEQTYGFIFWKGAWNDPGKFPGSHPDDPFKILPTRDGPPHTKPIAEGAAQFMIRQVHLHPHEVTIYEGGPMTNLAIAIGLDPDFAGLAKRLVFQGGAVGQIENADGFHSDFNLIFDPEAAHITLAAPWAKIVSLAEVSNPYVFDKALLGRIGEHPSAAGGYLARNSGLGLPLWEELGAAYIADPSIVTKSVDVEMDVDTDHGMSYGRTTVGSKDARPRIGVATVTILQEVDGRRFIDSYVAAVQADVSRRPGN